MNKKAIKEINTILFDFGDTLFRTINYNFSKGQEALVNYLQIKKKSSSLIRIQKELEYLFSERNKTVFELDFQKYLKLTLNLLNIYPGISYDEIELIFWKSAYQGELFDNVPDFLRKIKEKRFNVGIISNTAFSVQTLTYELKKQNIYSFFDIVISSCDYGIRKPIKYLFEIALARFNIQPVNAVYIGNRIETDMIGAENAGIQGYLFNPENSHVEKKYNSFKNYTELIHLFVGDYD